MVLNEKSRHLTDYFGDVSRSNLVVREIPLQSVDHWVKVSWTSKFLMKNNVYSYSSLVVILVDHDQEITVTEIIGN